MGFRKILLSAAVATATLAMALPAQAVPLEFSLLGSIDQVDDFVPPNGFGVEVGDDVTMVGRYDSSRFTFAANFLGVDIYSQTIVPNDGFFMNFFIGDKVFTQAQDVGFGDPLLGPTMWFADFTNDGDASDASLFDFSFLVLGLDPDPALGFGFDFEGGRQGFNGFFDNIPFSGVDPAGNNIFGFFNQPPVAGLVLQPVDANPVPEPGTLLLLGSGLVGLAGVGRRRRSEGA